MSAPDPRIPAAVSLARYLSRRAVRLSRAGDPRAAKDRRDAAWYLNRARIWAELQEISHAA